MKQKPTITTVLLISRAKYLDRVLESLVAQTLQPNNLLAVFDGPEHEFIEARNKVMQLKFEQKLCIKFDSDAAAATIPERRIRIADIHNFIRTIIPRPPHQIVEGYKPDWIFSIEDDGILQPDALERLYKIATKNKDTGMVTGVELGRWGVPYVGAWSVDNQDDPQIVKSLENKSTEQVVEELDAAGLYCALIRADFYSLHQFIGDNGLGPDINLGLFLRQQGFSNYIDWGVHVTHLTMSDGEEIEIKPTDVSKPVKMTKISGSTWYVSR